MVKFCQNCGSQLSTDDSLFCSRCGTKVSVSNPPKKKSEGNNQPFDLNEAIAIFYNLILTEFDDLDKLDEMTTIKFFIKLAENDLKQAVGFSREFRINRISIIQGILRELGFDINDNTVEYLYDSIISDMDLHKIPCPSFSNYEINVSVKKDEWGVIFFELMCVACDENIRFEIAEKNLKDIHQLELTCPNCSYKKMKISPSSLIRK